jgi:60 kDa SS-A/Ro ribonucleoprotein
MTNYAAHLTSTQQEKAHPSQVQNNAGGYVFQLTPWKRLERWLILGAEGGTYYVSERALTRDNAQTIQECLRLDGLRTVQMIVDISQSGRAPKNDPAIFALAFAAADTNEVTRKAAFAALSKVCRTGTHLFHFAENVDHLRQWGAGLRKAIARWYTDPPVDRVALQAIKYQQRDGWSHRDLLRLIHPQAFTPEREALFRWIVSGKEGLAARTLLNSKTNHTRSYGAIDESMLPRIVQGFEQAKQADCISEIVRLITEYQLPHECVPNKWKNAPEVWAAMLPHMGLTAMVRNLGKMSAVGLLVPLSSSVQAIRSALLSKEKLKQERIHPLSVLMALKVYTQGHGEKGHLSWQPNPGLIDALQQAFYLAFDTIEPTGKKHLLALDCSGSMDGSHIAGMSMSARQASAAMAMVTARTESHWHMCGFSTEFLPLSISPSMGLDEVVRTMARLHFGGTDCALPMLWATKNRIEVDTFVVYTDNETWAGNIHPYIALEQYRQRMSRTAKLIVVGMTSTGFSIADPNDPYMLDVVGFDTAVPALMADFSR